MKVEQKQERYSMQVSGIDEVKAKLEKLQKELSDEQMRRTMNTIGNIVRNKIEDSFENEASPFGKKWAPLKIISYHLGYTLKGGRTHTKKGKETAGFARYKHNKKILTDTGQLQSSFTIEATPSSVIVGTAKKYAAFHQFGTKKIPARPFLPVSDSGELEPKTKDAILDYLEQKIKKVF